MEFDSILHILEVIVIQCMAVFIYELLHGIEQNDCQDAFELHKSTDMRVLQSYIVFRIALQ